MLHTAAVIDMPPTIAMVIIHMGIMIFHLDIVTTVIMMAGITGDGHGEMKWQRMQNEEAMVKETAHAFRNRITSIGGLSQRMARLAKDTDLAKDSRVICREMLFLEEHLERFERYMDI